jgi:hypothetical protein
MEGMSEYGDGIPISVTVETFPQAGLTTVDLRETGTAFRRGSTCRRPVRSALR